LDNHWLNVQSEIRLNVQYKDWRINKSGALLIL
jgi:hypothetical protein